ncbi:hypothetical protein [Clostridium ganghwense]|uniref:Peptidase n=1 Tax=Clostridium ganghwense TaxID=312089 RepID=A0ABT4CQV8_9CLOT|nr:hypothetical protein [Clostridium ganghwense]MCY6371455.1 hypothetical protein [Clostridium ganghwense]
MSKIALMLLLTITAPSATSGAVNMSNTVTKTKVESKVDKELSKPSNSQKDKLAPIEIEGKITNISESKGGIMALVKGSGVNTEVKLVIDKKTEIVNQEGKKLDIKDLKDGIKVKAYYGPAATFSLPPISTAKKIIVMQEEEFCTTLGKILNVSNNKNNISVHVKGDKSYNAGLDEIILNISEKTEIVNEIGEKVSLEDLKEGVKVKAFYGPAVTLSIPAMSTAKKIIVIQHEDLCVTSGEILNVRDSKNNIAVHVKGKRLDNVGLDEIVLNVSEKTEIVNQKGEKLSIKDLKEGTKVKGYYGPAVTCSLPAMSSAKKIIIVQEDNLMGTEGKILEIKGGKNSSMIHIKGKKLEKGGMDEIILHVKKDTKIVNEEGKKLTIEDLKKGTEVKAYYGPKLTRSLPAQGFAEKVVVSETK